MLKTKLVQLFKKIVPEEKAMSVIFSSGIVTVLRESWQRE